MLTEKISKYIEANRFTLFVYILLIANVYRRRLQYYKAWLYAGMICFFQVNWKDIAGLDHLIQELRETVILPIQKRKLFADSRLTQPPKGVLLHGPPGFWICSIYHEFIVTVVLRGCVNIYLQNVTSCARGVIVWGSWYRFKSFVHHTKRNACAS